MKKKLAELQNHHAKILNDLIVEYAFYHSKEESKKARKELFYDYNERWHEHCMNNKNNKNIKFKFSGFKEIAGNNSKLNKIKRELGIPEISFFKNIF